MIDPSEEISSYCESLGVIDERLIIIQGKYLFRCKMDTLAFNAWSLCIVIGIIENSKLC